MNRTGSLSCLRAVTGISGVQCTDYGNRRFTGRSQKRIVSMEI